MDKDIVTVQSDYIVNLCAIQQEDMLLNGSLQHVQLR